MDFQIEQYSKFIHDEYILISMSFSFFWSKVKYNFKFNDGNILILQQKIENLLNEVEEEEKYSSKTRIQKNNNNK